MDYFRSRGYKFYTYIPSEMDGTFTLGTFKEHKFPENGGLENGDLLFVPPTRQVIDRDGKQWI
jgi:hypothetical protein